MSLCRHYVRELRRSTMVETPDLEKAGSKRSSYILDRFAEVNDPSGPSSNLNPKEKMNDANLSAFLRQDNGNGNGLKHSPRSSSGSQRSALRKSADAKSGDRKSSDRPVNGEHRTRASLMDNHYDVASPEHTVARADLRASAEKILYTFLLPGSEREIILPPGITQEITSAIEEDGRDDPEVFDTAKDYTFQAMERDAFPGFLRSKALGNLVPPSLFARLCLGLLGMFGGFWGGFACILLDLPKHIRSWVRSQTPDPKHQGLVGGEVFLANNFLPCFSLAHPPFHHWCLLPRIPAILARSDSCSDRTKRIHLHELVPHPRAIRATSPP